MPLWRGWGTTPRTQISRRFLPKRRASIDRAPGPRNARAIPSVASKIVPRGWSVPVRAIQSSLGATIAPAIGVHKPTSRKIPAMAAITCSGSDSRCGHPINAPMPSWIKISPTTTRSRRSPLPGQPLGNMEKRRCRKPPICQIYESRTRSGRFDTPNLGGGPPLFWGVTSQ